MAMAFAECLNEEARALAADGVDVIQFDEPAFNVYMDDVKRWGIDALHRAADGLKCKTAVHICYGYGIKANLDWKQTLGSEWRQYEEIFPALARSRIDQVSLECANSKVPARLMALLQGKDVLVGVIDVATDVVETPDRGRRRRSRKRRSTCRRSGSSPARTAAWRRWTGTSQPPSSRRSRPAHGSRASGSDSPVSTADPALVDDLVVANRILYAEGVVDGFGHISARHPEHANRFLLARSMAPALVEAGDIMEFDLDGNAAGGDTRRPYLERFIHGAIYRPGPT